MGIPPSCIRLLNFSQRFSLFGMPRVCILKCFVALILFFTAHSVRCRAISAQDHGSDTPRLNLHIAEPDDAVMARNFAEQDRSLRKRIRDVKALGVRQMSHAARMMSAMASQLQKVTTITGALLAQ